MVNDAACWCFVERDLGMGVMEDNSLSKHNECQS